MGSIWRELREGNSDRAVELIKNGADIYQRDDEGETLLHTAAENGQRDVVKILISKGFDVNTTNPNLINASPLDRAVFDGNSYIVSLLIEAGSNVNQKDDNGRTAIFRACWNLIYQPEAIKILDTLYANGADPKLSDTEGDTPLHCAAGGGRVDIVAWLLLLLFGYPLAFTLLSRAKGVNNEQI